jgi:hypothetical protein
MCHQRPAASLRKGLTLLELLVALILSVLLMAMLMPLLAAVTRPSQRLNVQPELAWSRALAADLREIVSPSKCAQPVLQMVPGSPVDPMPQLIVETFCRVGSGSGQIPPRGPNEVRYRLEPVEENGPLALVRYAQGWHDPLSSRLVVADHLTAWNITEQWLSPASATAPATRPSDEMPVAFDIQLIRMGSTESARFWIPHVNAPEVDTGSPDDTSSDSDSDKLGSGESNRSGGGRRNSGNRSRAPSGNSLRRAPGAGVGGGAGGGGGQQ